MTDYFTVPIPKNDDGTVDREQWLAAREGYANASDAYLIVSDPTEYVVRKLTGHVVEETPKMRAGRVFEAGIATLWEERHGITLHEPDVMFGHGRWLATLDRLTPTGDYAVEIKWTTHYMGDEPKPYWWWQAQAQLLCCPHIGKVVIACVDASGELIEYPVLRDREARDTLIDAANEAWAWIGMGMIPEESDLTADQAKRLWPQAVTDEVVELDALDVETLADLRRQAKEIEAAIEDVAGRITQTLAGSSRGVAGRWLVSWANQSKEGFDVARLREEMPEVAARYEKRSYFRTLKVKESK